MSPAAPAGWRAHLALRREPWPPPCHSASSPSAEAPCVAEQVQKSSVLMISDPLLIHFHPCSSAFWKPSKLRTHLVNAALHLLHALHQVLCTRLFRVGVLQNTFGGATPFGSSCSTLQPVAEIDTFPASTSPASMKTSGLAASAIGRRPPGRCSKASKAHHSFTLSRPLPTLYHGQCPLLRATNLSSVSALRCRLPASKPLLMCPHLTL